MSLPDRISDRTLSYMCSVAGSALQSPSFRFFGLTNKSSNSDRRSPHPLQVADIFVALVYPLPEDSGYYLCELNESVIS